MKPVRAIAAATAAIALAAAPAASALVVDLSQPGSDAHSPAVAVSAAGESAAVWKRRDPTTGRFVIQGASRQGSSYWSVGDLSNAGFNADAPQVAVDQAGHATAVWQRFTAQSITVIESATFLASTPVPPLGSPPPGVQIGGGSAGVNSQEPAIAVDPAGDALVAWQDNDQTSNRVSIHAAVRVGGGGFVGLGEISKPGPAGVQNDENPRVAIDQAGDAVVVWDHFDGTNDIIQAAIRPPGAAGFGTAFDVSVDPGGTQENAVAPQLAMNSSGEAVAIWRVGGGLDGHHSVIQAAELAAGAAKFGAPQDVSPEGVDVQSPRVGIDQAGNAVAVWERSDSGGSTLVNTGTLAHGSTTWNAAERPDAVAVGEPDLAVDPGGDAFAAWTGADGVNTSIYTIARPAGSAFGATLPLTSRGQSANSPSIALDAANNGFAVWERSDGKHTIISGYLPVPPPSPPPPGTGGGGPIGGCVNHPGLPPCPPPKLRLLRLTPGNVSTAGRIVRGRCVKPTKANGNRRHCTRPIALTITFTLPSPATVILTVKRVGTGRLGHGHCVATTRRNRTRRHCTLLTNLHGRITRHATTGANRFLFNGRIGGHVLKPGAYQLVVTPSLSGHNGTAVAATFKIVG